MTIRDFILSEKKSDRIKRHVIFWAFWGFYFTMVRFLNPAILMTTGHFPNFYITLVEAVLALLPQMVLAYSLINFVLPRFVFTGKYLAAALWFTPSLLLTYLITALFIMYVPLYSSVFFRDFRKLFSEERDFPTILMLAHMASLQGALTGASLAASFKMFKHYYVKNMRNQQLQQENMQAQLRLLTAQVHPHFLFNTLNNIYSSAQKESPTTAKMILELSHILRFVMEEGKLMRIPLENELQMIRDYINLEKRRYDEKLDLHYSFPSGTEHLSIAPLLLLPFVENCFKHGASKLLRNPWINLKIALQEETLVMKLMNGKKEVVRGRNGRTGTGIENVKKRLHLLYEGKHELNINEEEDAFVVNLKIELSPMPAALPNESLNQQHARTG